MMDGAKSATERSIREAAEAEEEANILRTQAAQMKQDFETLQDGKLMMLNSWLM